MRESVDTMLRLQIEQNPDLASFEDILRTFLAKYVSWDAVREELIQLYADAFTEDELRDVTAFYQTETGRKFVALAPSLTTQAMEIGQRATADHQGELEARIMARIQKVGGGRP